MMRFSVVFSKVDGLDEVDVGDSYALSAETIEGAEDQALALPVPVGANRAKILDEGRVVRRLGLDA